MTKEEYYKKKAESSTVWELKMDELTEHKDSMNGSYPEYLEKLRRLETEELELHRKHIAFIRENKHVLYD